MELKPNGVPVPGTYKRFLWPSYFNMWGDKITCYTSSAGHDQLIISGYVDTTLAEITDRQILIMNLKQNGVLLTAQHIGTLGTDVCNDLIFKKSSSKGNDYRLFLTGYAIGEIIEQAYFLSAKFNAVTGVTGVSEFSPFQNSIMTSQQGVEIKNAGNKKFAILATATYQPYGRAFANGVLLRDLNDTTGNCIKQRGAGIGQFNADTTMSTVAFDTPDLKVYSESWIKLGKLNVKEACQHINVDPSQAQNLQPVNEDVPQREQILRVTPNPAQSTIRLSTADGTKLTGNYKNAVIKIFNYSLQTQKVVSILPVHGNSIQIPVDRLIPGIYRIQLIRGNEMLGCSFIKE